MPPRRANNPTPATRRSQRIAAHLCLDDVDISTREVPTPPPNAPRQKNNKPKKPTDYVTFDMSRDHVLYDLNNQPFIVQVKTYSPSELSSYCDQEQDVLKPKYRKDLQNPGVQIGALTRNGLCEIDSIADPTPPRQDAVDSAFLSETPQSSTESSNATCSSHVVVRALF